MERICPFLALADDGRTVVDAYDPSQRCRASEPAEVVDRTQQLSVCLQAEHRTCPRFTAAMKERASGWPPVAADAGVIQTRLVIGPSLARRVAPGLVLGDRGRRWMLGGALATVGVVAVASGVAGSFGAMLGRAGESPSATPTAASSRPAVGSTRSAPPVTPSPSASPSPAPTATATPSPTPAPTQGASTPAPQPRTYVVRAGDSLSSIAVRFGTTPQAIAAANGLDVGAILNVGQVLIIP